MLNAEGEIIAVPPLVYALSHEHAPLAVDKMTAVFNADETDRATFAKMPFTLSAIRGSFGKAA